MERLYFRVDFKGDGPKEIPVSRNSPFSIRTLVMNWYLQLRDGEFGDPSKMAKSFEEYVAREGGTAKREFVGLVSPCIKVECRPGGLSVYTVEP